MKLCAPLTLAAVTALLSATAAMAGAAEAPEAFSNRPQLEIGDQDSKVAGGRPRSMFTSLEAIARDRVASEIKSRGVSVDLKDSVETLRGTNFIFQQRINGLEVFGAQFQVQVNEDRRIDSAVFNSLVSLPEGKALSSTPRVESEDEVFDTVWNALKADKVKAKPEIVLGYLPYGRELLLAYKVVLSVKEPLGVWRCYVDANSGDIIKLGRNRADSGGIPCENTMAPSHKRALPPRLDRKPGDRAAAFNAYLEREKAQAARSRSMASKAEATATQDGTGRAFDPDPRTALQDASLTAESDPESFNSAYKVLPLRQLTRRDGRVVLEGPYVKLADFDPPNIPPPQSTDGSFNHRLGERALGNVMAYFHIDRSQRYLQSIGFSGTKALQGGQIRVDANAENDDDNSHYDPSNNTITLGRGCAPDAEDADVILHEYGHALTHAALRRRDKIDSDWVGGDSQAVGEGFGDYWAATQRISMTPEHASFLPNRVFNWDASCGWPGRSLNADPARIRYNPDCTYGAHATQAFCDTGEMLRPFTEGTVSDELWSTPLFQAFLTLTREHKVPRAEIDRIILGAMPRLQSNFTMRQFAQLITLEAAAQYPTGPHKGVFEKQFMRFNILAQPTPAPDLIAAPGNGVAGGTGTTAPAKQ
jgi:hypothetical protein